MIELKNISKKFGSRQLFSDTNLHFEGGKIYALIGKVAVVRQHS